MVSFPVQKFFIWRNPIYFFFVSFALEDISANILLWKMPDILLPMFSSRIFMVSQLTFKSFNHFEFILVQGISWWSSFILGVCLFFFFLHVPVQLSQHHYWREGVYSTVCSCFLCKLLIEHKAMGLFLGFLFCCIELYACSYASQYLDVLITMGL